jgi:predicted anti-sigma-YlaC factor YlaD
VTKSDTLLLGRVAGAAKLCDDIVRTPQHYSRRVRRYARWARWFLSKLNKQLRKDIDNGV